MKSSTVDLVANGDERAAVTSAAGAVRRGERVLVVLGSGNQRVVPRLRRLCRAAKRQADGDEERRSPLRGRSQ
jgi:hypothetical protein